MVAEAKEVGPNRYREAYGRYLEDFKVGDIYEHRPGRSITESDNTWFTLLTMNQHPLHFDREYAAQSEFGKPLVNSCLTLSIVAGMSVSDISRSMTRACRPLHPLEPRAKLRAPTLRTRKKDVRRYT